MAENLRGDVHLENSDKLPGLSVDEISRWQYGAMASGYNNMARREIYKYSSMDSFSEIMKRLPMSGNETVLDLGCSICTDLIRLQKEYGHEGRLIGLDINDNLFYVPAEMAKIGEIKPLELIVGDAQRIPLPDNSVDRIFSSITLSHVPDQERAFNEVKRVGKNGGEFVFTISGDRSRVMHHNIEKMIALYLNRKPPEKFSERFNWRAALNLAIKIYGSENVEHEELHSIIHITKKDQRRRDYLASISTTRSLFKPYPSAYEWASAMSNIAESAIDYEIEQYGEFLDTANRHLYVATIRK